MESLRPGSPKPGRIQRIDGTTAADDDELAKVDDPVITQRFLKINVRHITDGQGVVGGVLLVTPNAVMFDPNVSDPLVIEHGPESYGVIAPIELCVNAAIFNDIAHMRVAGGPGSSGGGMMGRSPFAFLSGTNKDTNGFSTGSGSSTDKPEIYYPKTVLERAAEKEEAAEAMEETNIDKQEQKVDKVQSEDSKSAIVTVITTTDNENSERKGERTNAEDRESVCSASGTGSAQEVGFLSFFCHFL